MVARRQRSQLSPVALRYFMDAVEVYGGIATHVPLAEYSFVIPIAQQQMGEGLDAVPALERTLRLLARRYPRRKPYAKKKAQR